MSAYYYLIITSMPSYLHESDPYVFEASEDGGHHIPQVLSYLRDEVERVAEALESQGDEMAPWDELVGEIDHDIRHAADLDDKAFRYDMPDGYCIIAELKTPEELISLGYSVGEP